MQTLVDVPTRGCSWVPTGPNRRYGTELYELYVDLCVEQLDKYSKQTTLVHQIFGEYMRSEVTWNLCERASYTFQHFKDLNLDISTSDSVNDALANYFQNEPLDAYYTCQNCRMKGNATKKLFIEKQPNVLCIQLKRYSIGMDGPSNKNNIKPIFVNERQIIFLTIVKLKQILGQWHTGCYQW